MIWLAAVALFCAATTALAAHRTWTWLRTGTVEVLPDLRMARGRRPIWFWIATGYYGLVALLAFCAMCDLTANLVSR